MTFDVTGTARPPPIGDETTNKGPYSPYSLYSPYSQAEDTHTGEVVAIKWPLIDLIHLKRLGAQRTPPFYHSAVRLAAFLSVKCTYNACCTRYQLQVLLQSSIC